MAYGLKYRGYFTSTQYEDLDSIDYVIKLEFADYSGSVTDIKVTGFAEKNKAYDESLIGLKEVKFIFGVVTDTLSISDFYPDSERHVKVSLYKIVSSVETLVRSGFLNEENAKEAYVDGMRTLNISATDGLELLKGEKYEDENGKGYHIYPYSDRATIHLIINRCFERIGLGLNLNTAFNMHAGTSTPSANYDILVFRERGQKDFSGKSVYDVLSSMVKSLNCQLFQEDGEWWMVHLLSQRTGGQFYRKWDIENSGNYISGGQTGDALDVGYNEDIQALGGGNVTLERPFKRIVTKVSLSDYANTLLNSSFIPDGSGGFDHWTLNGLTVDNGGAGTKDDPYYLEIDGYQEGALFDRVDYHGVYQIVSLGDVDSGDSLEKMIRQQVRIKGEVLGNDIKKAFLGVYMSIRTDDEYLIYYLSEDGNWNTITLSLIDPIMPNTLKRSECIEIGLIDKDGTSFSKYASFDISSESIKEAADSKYPWFAYGLGGSGFSGVKGLSTDDFKEIEVMVVLYTGFERTDDPKGASYDTYVRYANVDLQVQDTLASQRSKEIRFVQETSSSSNRELNVERSLIDFEDKNQTLAITTAGVPTTTWVTNDDTTPRELVVHLNKEILYATHLPQNFFDGDLKGLISRRRLLNFYGITAPSICVSWNYDFGESIASGVRYHKLWDSEPSFVSKKFGTQEDGREVEFSTEGLPPSIIKEEPSPHIPRKNSSKTGVHNGNLVVEKGSEFSGALNFVDETGLVTDLISPVIDGMYLKAEAADGGVIFVTENLTSDQKLIIPLLTADATIATDSTAWMLGAPNILTAKSYIGSASGDFDIGIKRNGLEVVTVGNGRVGINNAFPSVTLDVAEVGVGSAYVKINRLSDSVQAGYLYATGGAVDWYNYMEAGNNSLSWYNVNAGVLLTLAEAGKVGIKTANPTEELDVIGTIRATNLKVTSGKALGYIGVSDADGELIWTDPAALNSWAGNWNASTNSPSLSDGSGTYGSWYHVEVPGTHDFGSGDITFALGDRAIYDGAVWEKQTQNYTLNPASSSVLGGIKVGSGLAVTGGGVLSSLGYTQTEVDAFRWDNTSGELTTLKKAKVGLAVTFGTAPTFTVRTPYTGIPANLPALINDSLFLPNDAFGVGGLAMGSLPVDATYKGKTFIQNADGWGGIANAKRAILLNPFEGNIVIGTWTDNETDLLQVAGNVSYSGDLKPIGGAGTDGEVLFNRSGVDTWDTISVSDVSGLSTTLSDMSTTIDGAWQTDGSNTLSAKAFLGSSSGDYDIGIKRNGVEIVTIKDGNAYVNGGLDGDNLLSNTGQFLLTDEDMSGMWMSDVTGEVGFVGKANSAVGGVLVYNSKTNKSIHVADDSKLYYDGKELAFKSDINSGGGTGENQNIDQVLATGNIAVDRTIEFLQDTTRDVFQFKKLNNTLLGAFTYVPASVEAFGTSNRVLLQNYESQVEIGIRADKSIQMGDYINDQYITYDFNSGLTQSFYNGSTEVGYLEANSSDDIKLSATNELSLTATDIGIASTNDTLITSTGTTVVIGSGGLSLFSSANMVLGCSLGGDLDINTHPSYGDTRIGSSLNYIFLHGTKFHFNIDTAPLSDGDLLNFRYNSAGHLTLNVI